MFLAGLKFDYTSPGGPYHENICDLNLLYQPDIISWYFKTLKLSN